MLHYIKQHIQKLVIAGDYEAASEGQSSQPENSGDAFIQIRVEVKRLIFLPEYLDFSQLLI